MIIWGNHSKTQFPDTFNAAIGSDCLREVMSDKLEWLDGDFLARVQNRGGEIISVMGKSSAASAANAVCDHVRDLHHGTGSRRVSMAVLSDGNSFGIPEGIFYSFPVKIQDGDWTIENEEFEINDFMRERLDASATELIEERTMAFAE